MPRSALIFLVAIFLPSLVLGWLALRTAGEQRILIERQEADLRQAETDALAAQIRESLIQKQSAFSEIVRGLIRQRGTAELAERFELYLIETWTDGGIPFAVTPDGALAFPPLSRARTNAAYAQFFANSSAFLSNRITQEVFQSQQALVSTQSRDRGAEKKRSPDADVTESKLAASSYGNRNVVPQKSATLSEAQLSKVAPALSNFQDATENAAQGTLARFVQNELEVIFWTRPDPGSNWLFGVMLAPPQIQAMLESALPDHSRSDAQFAILNERGRPVARQPTDFTAEWKRPFVATEIGEALPQWEVALYLTEPGKLTDSARLITLTLILLIAVALAAIVAGGFFIARDANRQIALAQKKTDFVANVSHELKTPLTSIRLFAEMLEDGRVTDSEKQHRYLRIIRSESERLTRLVNNVLDFARTEKNRQGQTRQTFDARELIANLWENESERLRERGFTTHWQAEAGPYSVHADPDALSQILVNLLANAEKYSNGTREIELRSHLRNGQLEIVVADRGIGIPKALTDKIFEPFFRADDSLASGVQGTGLGLTLARRMAREHGGALTAHAREGGGSEFILTLPLT